MLHGAQDRHATLAEAQAIYDNLRSGKELVVFAGAGHTSLLEADPEQWRTVIGQFLAKQVE